MNKLFYSLFIPLLSLLDEIKLNLPGIESVILGGGGAFAAAVEEPVLSAVEGPAVLEPQMSPTNYSAFPTKFSVYTFLNSSNACFFVPSFEIRPLRL